MGNSTSRNSGTGWWHRHPVLTNASGSVVGTIALGALAQFAGWIDLPAWWRAAMKAATTAWQWVIAETLTPHWLLTIMGLAMLGWLAVLVMLLTSNQKEATRMFNVLAYDTDIFFNMRWRWRWGQGVGPRNLVPFCLKCDMQIDPARRGGGYAVVAPLVFPCKLCGVVQYEIGHGDKDLEDVERDVTLLIQRNVRQMAAKHQQQGESLNGS